ncbi:hypothetical protein ACHAPK_010977 [Fusarium culmorum]
MGNAAGATTPPWLIFKSLPTLEWAYIEADSDMRFAQSDTRFSNAEITLEWAKHFNQASWEKSATVQHRQLDFEEWFGCNEHLQDQDNRFVTHDVPPKERSSEEIIWRLLIIDGFTGRGTFSHQKQEIFNEGFTAAHIINGFQKSGIYPPTDRPAIEYLLRKQLKTKKTFTPAHISLLPSEMRFHAASSTAESIGERYHDILSSPTRAGLQHIRNIVHEVVMLEDVIKQYVDDRKTRIEKRYHERKRGRRAKTVSDLITFYKKRKSRLRLKGHGIAWMGYVKV